MIEATIVSILAICFALIAKRKEGWLIVSFILITLFLSLGYNWGNDVESYYQMFILSKEYSTSLFDFSYAQKLTDKGEYGWPFLNNLFQPLGFCGLRLFLFSFQNFLIYWNVKHYVSKDFYWLALFVYTFNVNLMVLSSSMMRQSFTMAIVLLAFDLLIFFVRKAKRILGVVIYLSIVYCASLFHRSALFSLPLGFLCFLRFNFKLKHLLWYFLFAAIWFLVGYRLFTGTMMSLLSADFENYSVYEEGGKVGIGVVFNIMLYIFMFSCFNIFTKEQKLIAIFSCLSVLILPFIEISEFISRLAIYFVQFSILSIPIFMKNSPRLYKLLLFPYFVITLYGFSTFWYSRIWHNDYFYYTTIFSVGGWY